MNINPITVMMYKPKSFKIVSDGIGIDSPKKYVAAKPQAAGIESKL